MLSSLFTTQYLFTYDRQGGNSWVSNLYLNNLYMKVKENLLTDFDVMNRKFTEDEVRQFLHNKALQEKGPKMYVYNPMLHQSEDEYKADYERMNSGKFMLSEKSKNEIRRLGARKELVGEEIRIKPFDIGKLSRSSLNTKLIYNQAIKGCDLVE